MINDDGLQAKHFYIAARKTSCRNTRNYSTIFVLQFSIHGFHLRSLCPVVVSVLLISFHSKYEPQLNYSLAPHNDISVNDGPHIRLWSHKIIL